METIDVDTPADGAGQHLQPAKAPIESSKEPISQTDAEVTSVQGSQVVAAPVQLTESQSSAAVGDGDSTKPVQDPQLPKDLVNEEEPATFAEVAPTTKVEPSDIDPLLQLGKHSQTDDESWPAVSDAGGKQTLLDDASMKDDSPNPTAATMAIKQEHTAEPVPSSIDPPTPVSKSARTEPSQSAVSATQTSIPPSIPTPASIDASQRAESSATGTKRLSPTQTSVEMQEKARQDEVMRLQKENDDMRLMWLSLPVNDHITYYSDTEEDASSSVSDINGLAPEGAYGGIPFLTTSSFGEGAVRRKRARPMPDDERESSDSDDENLDREELGEEKRFRTGNRGTKLQKGARWIRRGKFGLWTEAKTEKEMHDRFMSRVKAIQRAGVESLLHNAPGPKAIKDDGPLDPDMLDGSDRMLLKDVNATVVEENLHSTSLAPALLRPILSSRALLDSHTLRHTFRNPHIGALSKTALDLRESEGQLSRALGRCFAAIERISAYVKDADTGEMRVNGSQGTDGDMDDKVVGAEGTAGTADEVNPALYRLEELFVTRDGLPIPVPGTEGEGHNLPNGGETQALLSTHDQRNVVRAALECLHDLGTDSMEYVERLDEVRGRLEAVKRRRTQVWEALRLWAIRRECGESDEDEGDGEEDEAVIDTVNSRLGGKPPIGVAAGGGSATLSRRRR